MADKARIGVLVMSYGTPESMDQIEEYYTHIRHGRKPSPEQLQDLIHRYEAIVGGFFPLRKNTDRQVAALEDALNRGDGRYTFQCYQGLKHAKPFVADGVEEMAKDGLKEAIGLVLAPHYSTMSVGSYIKEARTKADELGISMQFVESYHLNPSLIQALTNRVMQEMAAFSSEGTGKDEVEVLFTAHSLPERILAMKDPYPVQLMETAKIVAEKSGITRWRFAWQSAGRTAEPWLGPDILDVLRKLRHEENTRNVLVCPVGFVSDHLEVLYDVDIECQALAAELGMNLKRTESLNIDPLYMEALRSSILSVLENHKAAAR
ncbi:ferrochelatase [Gorillibacterium massiliense]|uniref:ferrochelatase n=1 Tax=Gorillibacterium massiliense TaxID=1280390 RepID=UPI0004B8E938|nr:ferrochelatase [Gorillibacterium massiliense]